MYEDFHYNLTPGVVAKFKNTEIMSCDVKRSFSKCKIILRSNKKSFNFENLKHLIIIL